MKFIKIVDLKTPLKTAYEKTNHYPI